MQRLTLRALAVVSILAIAAGCGDNDAVTDPTPPERQTFTETFEGRLTINGAATHSFVANGSGLMTATVTSLSPDPEARISVSLGTWNGVACQIVIARDDATQGSVVTGQAGSAGNFCVRVLDAGLLTAPTDYTLTVVHF